MIENISGSCSNVTKPSTFQRLDQGENCQLKIRFFKKQPFTGHWEKVECMNTNMEYISAETFSDQATCPSVLMVLQKPQAACMHHQNFQMVKYLRKPR